MSIIVGIDVGGSTTKIVGFDGDRLLEPGLVKANDPIASVYGGFGKFTTDNKISLSDIEKVMVTGVGSDFLGDNIYGIEAVHVNEFIANGKGGLYLSGLDEAIVVSMGTGTAYVYSNRKTGEYTHLGGTGVGGGTLVGIADKLLGIRSAQHVAELALGGDLKNIDLMISDITQNDISPTLKSDITASNFGKVSDMATREDIALGLVNMVFETIAMMAIFSARMKNIKDIILIGNLTVLPQAETIFKNLESIFGVNIIIPKNAAYGTVIGAALEGAKNG
ncbi:MAG: type II pantothenate kinase [Ruminococcaceae bacterium]|nr:type II pantothenate kinase [Oscillospiraceae bacterium]